MINFCFVCIDIYSMGVYNPNILGGSIRRYDMEEKECCMCCKEEKKTMRTDAQKKALLNRLKRIEGQIRGLQSMIEYDAYCNDILQQSSAANAAINAFNRELISYHIKGCVTRDIKNGNEEIVDELVDTLRKLMK